MASVDGGGMVVVQRVAEMLFSAVETVLLHVENAALCVFRQVCVLVIACFSLSWAAGGMGEVVAFSCCALNEKKKSKQKKNELY